MTEPATIYLVRHGATDANLRRPYILQGCGIDLSLNDVGRRQADAVARFLSERPLRAIYSSWMRRAAETAAAIAAPHGLPPRTADGIAECDVGEWEGMDWESIRARNPDEWARFQDDPAAVPYLGGESYGNVLTRAMPAIRALADLHRGETIAVVAHNVVNRVVSAHLLGMELRRAKELRQANCCVNLLHGTGETLKLVTMNSHFHLPADLVEL